MYLENSIIDGEDLYLEDSLIDDDMYLEDEIIGDDRSEEDTVINENSNEDESFIMDDPSEDEALIELESLEDQFNEDDDNKESLIGNIIEHSEEIVKDKDEYDLHFSKSNKNIENYIEKDFIPKLHSYETVLKNQNIFNSLDKAQKKVKVSKILYY